MNQSFNLIKDTDGRPEYYSASLSALRSYCGSDSIECSMLTSRFIADFIIWLLRRGASKATSASYFRAIRSLYNRDVKNGLVSKNDCFKTVPDILQDNTNVLSDKDMSKLASHDFGTMTGMAKARDIFMFCFYAGGLDFPTLCNLSPEDVTDNFLNAGDRSILVLNQMEDIISRHSDDNRIFPFLSNWDIEGYSKALYAISIMLELKVVLTPESAAETWKLYSSSGFNGIVKSENPVWRAIRNHSFGSRDEIKELLQDEVELIFIPVLRKVIKTNDGKLKHTEDSLIKKLLFAKATQEQADSIQKKLGNRATVIFSFDGFRKVYNRIPATEMNSFIFTLNEGGFEFIDSDGISVSYFKPGERVLISGHPILDGLTGSVLKDDGNDYLDIMIEGVGLTFLTQHIHRGQLRKL